MDGAVSIPPPPPPPSFFTATNASQIPPPPPPPPSFFTETTASPIPPPPPAPPLPQSVATETVTTTTTVTTNVPNPSNNERIWLHPWTVNEMRDNASHWSLAGDAGLLLYLEQFSDKLVQRADAIQQHLNQTVNAVKSTHTRVQNCLNEFTSLANTQFIENRVYDEDETASATDTKKEEQPADKTNVSNAEAQEKLLQRCVEAVQYGLTILDTHFERVDTKLDSLQNAGASYVDDEEDGGVPIEPILEPKDQYIYRPLPYLIATPEFMQDDYVGLGYLLEPPDDERIGIDQKPGDPDSAIPTSDDDDDDSVQSDEFQAKPSTVPIVAAGDSRPDYVPPLQPVSVNLSDTDEDEDPFAPKTDRKFEFFSEKKPPTSEQSDRKQVPTPKANGFDFEGDSSDEEDPLFGTVQKPALPAAESKEKDLFKGDPSESDESDEAQSESESKAPPSTEQKHYSALEEAVLRRRIAMGDPDVPDDVKEALLKKSAKAPNKPASSTETKVTTKSVSETPPPTIASNAPQQHLATPGLSKNQTPNTSIFAKSTRADDDDEEADIFNFAPTSKSFTPATTSSIAKTETKPLISKPPIKDDIFGSDNSDDDTKIFQPKKNDKQPSLPTKQVDSIIKPQSTMPSTSKKTIEEIDSDGDDLFGVKKNLSFPSVTTTSATKTEIKKPKESSSADDDSDGDGLFVPSMTVKLPVNPIRPANADPLSSTKLSTQEQPKQSVASPPVPSTIAPARKTTLDDEADSEDELFGLKSSKAKSKPATTTTKTVKKTATHSESSDDPDFLSGPKPNTSVAAVKPSEVLPPPSTKSDQPDKSLSSLKPATAVVPKSKPTQSSTDSDDDDKALFGTPQPKPKAPTTTPQIVKVEKPADKKEPFASQPSVKTTIDEDPLLVIQKSTTETKPKSPTAPIVSAPKKPLSDSDEDLFKASQPKAAAVALNEDKKPSGVKALAASLNIKPNAFMPGGARPKPSAPAEEPLDKSIDDEQSVAPVVKKSVEVDSGSESDNDLFSTKTKAIPSVEQKETVDGDSKPKSALIKDLSSRMKIPMMSPSSPPTRPVSSEKPDTSETKETIAKEEPVADKTMLDILKDRTKVAVRTRAPPTRKSRLGGAAAAAASTTNISDDLFGTSSSTTTSTTTTVTLSSPPPPVTTSPAVDTAAPVKPPPAPVTGLPDEIAPIAAIFDKQSNIKEKKKISLFDSDDSDIDELLFGSSKKTKSSAVSKSTTSSTTPKTTPKTAASLPLDDDDDFLSKRPVKKTPKPLDNDDIFGDIQTKSQPANKAKKDWSIMNKKDTDDIFNDTSVKSSTTAKSKSTSVKSKANQDVEDIFDDPLNVTSKR
ncbi:unnamed protein product [Adineta ricciae]|uniref:Uncharacterized protein n=1 Tax=Adineta ricciae TaxID=249248 RepID=A0A813XWD4_ADIRI|nr:unnamed protein product [Adineta ricciae]